MIHYKNLHCRGRGSHSLLSLLLYILIWLYLSSSVPLINMKRLCSFISASEELWSPWLQPCSFTFTISLAFFFFFFPFTDFAVCSPSWASPQAFVKQAFFSISPYCTWCKANHLKGDSLFRELRGFSVPEVKSSKVLQVQGGAVLLVLAKSHLPCKGHIQRARTAAQRVYFCQVVSQKSL